MTRKDVTPAQARCPICGAVHVGRLLKPPKSRAGRRCVPLAAPAQEALVRHRGAQRIERDLFGADYDEHDLVFCRPDGAPLRPDRVTAEFERIFLRVRRDAFRTSWAVASAQRRCTSGRTLV